MTSRIASIARMLARAEVLDGRDERHLRAAARLPHAADGPLDRLAVEDPAAGQPLVPPAQLGAEAGGDVDLVDRRVEPDLWDTVGRSRRHRRRRPAGNSGFWKLLPSQSGIPKWQRSRIGAIFSSARRASTSSAEGPVVTPRPEPRPVDRRPPPQMADAEAVDQVEIVAPTAIVAASIPSHPAARGPRNHRRRPDSSPRCPWRTGIVTSDPQLRTAQCPCVRPPRSLTLSYSRARGGSSIGRAQRSQC